MANTTTDKLNKILNTKADIKAALAEKGQTVGDVFADYPAAVRAIDSGAKYTQLTVVPIIGGKFAEFSFEYDIQQGKNFFCRCEKINGNEYSSSNVLSFSCAYINQMTGYVSGGDYSMSPSVQGTKITVTGACPASITQFVFGIYEF